MIIPPELLSQIDALVASWLPGSEGMGVADVLFGKQAVHRQAAGHAGRGRWPRSRSTSATPGYDPLYRFGFGLAHLTGRRPDGGYGPEAWLPCASPDRSCPTASPATSTSWTAGSPSSRRPAPRRWPAAGWCPGLVDAHCHVGLDEHGEVDREATEAAGGRRPRRRRAAAPRLRQPRRHPLGPGPRRPAPADPDGPAHRPHPALHPRLRVGGRAGRADDVRRAGGAPRRRLGEARRRLDRARPRRPGAVVPGRRVHRGDRDRARARGEGHRALLRHRGAADPHRRRHRLHRARHRADRPT